MIISETKSELFSALIRARTDIETLVKDKAGYGYNYATLDNVINMLKGVLPLYDLGFAQFPETIDGKDGVTTIVFHKSGEYMSARYEMEATEMKGTNLTQQKGASITYTRRYALCSVFGIPTEEDTDGRTDMPIKPASTHKPTSDHVPDINECVNAINDSMTLDNWKAFYARAIELFPKNTPEYKQWSAAFNTKKANLETQQRKNDLDAEFAAFEQI